MNSLHGQGIDRLAAGLHVEAIAPDGLVEAFSLPQAPEFCLSVQWHPEWMAADNPVSMRVLAAFGAAVRARQARQVADNAIGQTASPIAAGTADATADAARSQRHDDAVAEAA